MIKFYGYNKCSTCVKAKKLLVQQEVRFDDIDITTTPPAKAELKSILKSGSYQIKDLFNRSGEQYRELNMKEKLPKLSEDEALDLLVKNGRLVKRPIVTDGKQATVGFDEKVFKQTW